MKRLYTILVLALLLLSANSRNGQTGDDYFARGLLERDQGNHREALTVWSEGWNNNRESGDADPRIGIAFVELAAQIKDRSFYERATAIYMWAFSGNSVIGHEETIEKEIERIKPLLDDSEYDEWMSLLQEYNAQLLVGIRGFWLNKDLTPTTILNERLLEHWERIAYAREHYRRNIRPPYGTDDRGRIYVKYGKPDKHDSGNLGRDVSELKERLDGFRLTIGPNPNTSLGYSVVNSAYVNFLQWNPEYEVWVYSNHYMEENAVYIFGRPVDKSFGLLNSLEEMIPNDLFGRRNSLIVNTETETIEFSPGSLVELMYYSQLTLVDKSFADRYIELSSDWDAVVPPSRTFSLSLRNKFIALDLNDPVKLKGPRDRTDFGNSLIPIHLYTKKIRTLDRGNNQALSVIAVSYPDLDGDGNIEWPFDDSDLRSDYTPLHTLMIRNANMDEINRLVQLPVRGNWDGIKMRGGSDSDKTFYASHFLITPVDSTLHFTIAAEALIEAPNPDDASNMLAFPFLGTSVPDRFSPLERDFSQLEISDIISGISFPESVPIKHYPYPVLPVEQVRKEDFFEIYLEIYHLQKGSDNKARYSITFQLTGQKDAGIISRLFRRVERDEVSVTSNFESNYNRSSEHIAFDISDLEQSEYEFQVIVTDLLSGQSKARKGTFVVIQ